jgi:hypothetical protein
VRDDAAGSAQQAGEQIELGGGEMDRRAVAFDPPRFEVDQQPVALEVLEAGCSAEPRWRSATRMRASNSAMLNGLIR